MAVIDLGFRPEAPELRSISSFWTFFGEAAMNGFLGHENARRLLIFCGDLDSDLGSRLDEYREIIDQVSEVKGPEQHPITANVLPLVRMSSDFRAGETVAYQSPDEGSRFVGKPVHLIEDPMTAEEHANIYHRGDEIESGGITLDHNPRGWVLMKHNDERKEGYVIETPQWPGLLPFDLFFRIINKSTKHVVTFGNIYVRSTFFDQVFDFGIEDESPHTTSAFKSLRNLHLTPEYRPR